MRQAVRLTDFREFTDVVQRISATVNYSDLSAGAGRGSRTPKTRRSADFESAASASSAIPA